MAKAVLSLKNTRIATRLEELLLISEPLRIINSINIVLNRNVIWPRKKISGISKL
jgi:hypothetical protein